MGGLSSETAVKGCLETQRGNIKVTWPLYPLTLGTRKPFLTEKRKKTKERARKHPNHSQVCPH